MAQVKSYIVRIWGGTDGDSKDGRARIQLNDDSNTLGFIYFFDEGKPVPNDFKTVIPQSTQELYSMHLPSSQFASVVDLLRNESPVYFSFLSTTNHALLNTINEPVGEGE